jgi:hypothetical protein
MKAQNQVSKQSPNHQRMLITSIIEFNKLSNSQKEISSTLYALERGNSLSVVFSIEDVFHDLIRCDLIKKDILASTSFLAAYMIPFTIQCN